MSSPRGKATDAPRSGSIEMTIFPTTGKSKTGQSGTGKASTPKSNTTEPGKSAGQSGSTASSGPPPAIHSHKFGFR